MCVCVCTYTGVQYTCWKVQISKTIADALKRLQLPCTSTEVRGIKAVADCDLSPDLNIATHNLCQSNSDQDVVFLRSCRLCRAGRHIYCSVE